MSTNFHSISEEQSPETRILTNEEGKPFFREEELWWGPNNCMVLAAFVQCIGQDDIMCGMCAQWLQNNWHKLYTQTKLEIIEHVNFCLSDDHVRDSFLWKPIADATPDTIFKHPWPESMDSVARM